MKAFFSAALLAASAALLAGCETTLDLPEPPHKVRVALLHVLTTEPNDSSFRELYDRRRLYVSNSQRVFDQRELLGRTDATVELRNQAGAVVERYRPLRPGNSTSNYPGYYQPTLNFRPQPGQTYTLRTTLPNLETAESTQTMPQPAVVESGSYAPRPAGPNTYEHRGRLNLVLRDDPAVANYYLAFARVLDQQGRAGDWSPVDVDYDSQSSAVAVNQFQLSSPQQEYSIAPFADTELNGQRISLTTDVRFYNYNCQQGNCPPPAFIEVHVSSITREVYNFYLSRLRYFDSNGNPFAEPAPLASNVRAGYGLFGAATDVKYRIRIP